MSHNSTHQVLHHNTHKLWLELFLVTTQIYGTIYIAWTHPVELLAIASGDVLLLISTSNPVTLHVCVDVCSFRNTHNLALWLTCFQGIFIAQNAVISVECRGVACLSCNACSAARFLGRDIDIGMSTSTKAIARLELAACMFISSIALPPVL